MTESSQKLKDSVVQSAQNSAGMGDGASLVTATLPHPTIEQSSIVAATVKPDLTVGPVSEPYKLDWTDQWNDCDVCECCGNLVSGGQLFNRLSLAVTMLYTHGALTSGQRDSVRKKLTAIAKATQP